MAITTETLAEPDTIVELPWKHLRLEFLHEGGDRGSKNKHHQAIHSRLKEHQR